jgi:mono/diheme cytochrome c family protein
MSVRHKLRLIKLFKLHRGWYYLGLAGLVALSLISCARNDAPEEQAFVPPIDRGAELYETHCFSCHGGDSGGQMMDMPPRHNANGHTWHHPDCQLTDIVLNGSGEMGQMMRQMMGGEDLPPMPTFKGQLSEEEVAAILAYIKTWWTEEQRQLQAEVTQEACG